MNGEFEKIEMARTVLEKIARGIDPVNGEVLKEGSFINDPGIIRCFFLASEVLDNVRKGVYSSQRQHKFVISDEQKNMVRLPDGKIGVNEFSRCINECLDLSVSKRLTGVELNRHLKALGVLSEENGSNGKTRTVINGNSDQYGFESEKREYNGNEYEMVVINDKGKKYLLDELDSIMAIAV